MRGNLQKQVPWRNPAYRAHVRSFVCSVCGNPDTVAHHEQPKGCGGLATKIGDQFTISLCCRCHLLRHSQGRSWWQKVNRDPEAIIARLQGEWVKRGGSLPKESPL